MQRSGPVREVATRRGRNVLPVARFVKQAERNRTLRPTARAVGVGPKTQGSLKVLRSLGDDLALRGFVVFTEIVFVLRIAKAGDIRLDSNVHALAVPLPHHVGMSLSRLGREVEGDRRQQAVRFEGLPDVAHRALAHFPRPRAAAAGRLGGQRFTVDEIGKENLVRHSHRALLLQYESCSSRVSARQVPPHDLAYFTNAIIYRCKIIGNAERRARNYRFCNTCRDAPVLSVCVAIAGWINGALEWRRETCKAERPNSSIAHFGKSE